MRFPGAADDYFVTVNQVHFLLTSLNVISAFREFKRKRTPNIAVPYIFQKTCLRWLFYDDLIKHARVLGLQCRHEAIANNVLAF